MSLEPLRISDEDQDALNEAVDRGVILYLLTDEDGSGWWMPWAQMSLDQRVSYIREQAKIDLDAAFNRQAQWRAVEQLCGEMDEAPTRIDLVACLEDEMDNYYQQLCQSEWSRWRRAHPEEVFIDGEPY